MKLATLQEVIRIEPSIKIGETIDMRGYQGIVDYYPDELTLTVKAGTIVGEIRTELHKHNQDFDFYAADEEMIGTIYARGGHFVRMSVLGVQIIDGRGEVLHFGGEVMKNVAGYDVARLLCGSRGQCALITQISFKVLPRHLITHNLKADEKNTISPALTTLNQQLFAVFDPNKKFQF